MRYQGEEVVTADAEYLWGLTPRWSLVFFGGVGKTFSISEFEVQGETVAAGGIGFRYYDSLCVRMGVMGISLPNTIINQIAKPAFAHLIDKSPRQVAG